mgnify:CR=1 FL=1
MEKGKRVLFIFICAWKSGCCGGVTSAAAAFCRYLEEVLRYFEDSQNLLTSNIIQYIVLNGKTTYGPGNRGKGMSGVFS